MKFKIKEKTFAGHELFREINDIQGLLRYTLALVLSPEAQRITVYEILEQDSERVLFEFVRLESWEHFRIDVK